MTDEPELYDQDPKFREWIRALDEDVIQGEYGYEAGEYTVYWSHWIPQYEEGLTPAQAFKRALDAHAEAREEELERRRRWASENMPLPPPPDSGDGDE